MSSEAEDTMESHERGDPARCPITQKKVQSLLEKEQGGEVSWRKYTNLRLAKAGKLEAECSRREARANKFT